MHPAAARALLFHFVGAVCLVPVRNKNCVKAEPLGFGLAVGQKQQLATFLAVKCKRMPNALDGRKNFPNK